MHTKIKIASLLILISLFSCSEDDNIVKKEKVITKESVTIKLDSRFQDNNFELEKNFTINDRTYNFKQLRYWVSNISLVKENGDKVTIPNSYFLMEENIEFESPNSSNGSKYPANKREEITVNLIPSGKYKSIIFSIGVDPKYNDNLSLQAGELSHGNGMVNLSWMWLSSYIFTKAVGTVTQDGKTKNFVADTGLNTNYKTITVDSSFEVKANSTNMVNINLNVEKLFTNLDVFKTNIISANTPNEMKQLSDNYSHAFSTK